MKALNLLLAFSLTAAASAADLNWSDLAARPELWPAQCAVKQTIKFEGGVNVPAGQKVNVLSFKGGEVEVGTLDGKTTFTAAPDETDVLAVAREGYAKLTPKQRELTYPLLAQRRELWPYYIVFNKGFDLAKGGPTVRAGDKALLKDIQPGQLLVVCERLNARFNVTPAATDLMTQARKFVEDDEAGPRLLVIQKQAEEKQKLVEERMKLQGRTVLELEGKMINSVSGQPEPLDTNALPRYFVFLRGSETCPITRDFTPKLVKFYHDMKPAHAADFEVIYLTIDSKDDTEKYAKEAGFSWRTVEYETSAALTSLRPTIDGRVPQLIVTDRTGKVLVNGLQATAAAALSQLDALLKQPK